MDRSVGPGRRQHDGALHRQHRRRSEEEGRSSIVNDGLTVTAAGGFGATGSPFVTPIAPPFALTLSPASQRDGGRAGTSVPYHLTIANNGSNADTYTLSASGGWPTTFFDASCTTALTTTPSVAGGDSLDVCAKVAVPAGAANMDLSTNTVTATSVGSSSLSATASIGTLAIVGGDTLLVDNDDNAPDVQAIYKAALDANTISYLTWDLKADKDLGLNYTKSFTNIVWFTGNSYPAPMTPYEAALKGFLDNGGRLFVSGQDLLDQSAGTTPFVHDYLHITWDGTETQNDKATAQRPRGRGHADGRRGHRSAQPQRPRRRCVRGSDHAERHRDGDLRRRQRRSTTALSYSGTYKVVFLAFPIEAYGTAAQKANLISRAFTFFGP